MSRSVQLDVLSSGNFPSDHLRGTWVGDGIVFCPKNKSGRFHG